MKFKWIAPCERLICQRRVWQNLPRVSSKENPHWQFSVIAQIGAKFASSQSVLLEGFSARSEMCVIVKQIERLASPIMHIFVDYAFSGTIDECWRFIGSPAAGCSAHRPSWTRKTEAEDLWAEESGLQRQTPTKEANRASCSSAWSESGTNTSGKESSTKSGSKSCPRENPWLLSAHEWQCLVEKIKLGYLLGEDFPRIFLGCVRLQCKM